MTNSKIIGYGSAIISTTLMGVMGFFVRNIASNEYIITFARLGIGLIILIPFMFIKKESSGIKIKRFSFYLLSTGVIMSLAILCYIRAINTTSLSNAVFLLYLAPLIATGISALLLREKFTLLNGGLLCLAFLGFLFLLEFNFSLNLNESKGYLWGIGAAILYALYIVFNRKIPEDIPALTRSFYQFLFGSITMLPFLIDTSILMVTAKDMCWLIAVGFFQGFLALSLLIVAIKKLSTIEYGTISYIEPLVASLVGVNLYSENFASHQIIGCAIIFLGGLVQVVASNKTIKYEACNTEEARTADRGKAVVN